MKRFAFSLTIPALVLGLAAPTIASSADGDLSWDFLNDRNYMTMTLRHKDPKAPLPFLAACEERGAVKLSIGAPLDKVTEAADTVSLALDSGGVSAKLSGKATFNDFTKVFEIVLETTTDNKVFDVLATGKPITVTGPAKTAATWPAPNAELATVWRNDCTTRSEH